MKVFQIHESRFGVSICPWLFFAANKLCLSSSYVSLSFFLVAEVFFLGEGEKYLEVEVGP